MFGFYGQDELRRLINMCDPLRPCLRRAEIEGNQLYGGAGPRAGAGHLGFAAFRHRPVRAVRGEPVPCGRRGMILRAGSITGVEHPEEKRAYAEQYALRQDENRVEAPVARAEEMYASAIRDKRRKGYRKVPSAAGGAVETQLRGHPAQFLVRAVQCARCCSGCSPTLLLSHPVAAGPPLAGRGIEGRKISRRHAGAVRSA